MYFPGTSNLLLPTVLNQAVKSSCCVHIAVGHQGEMVKFNAPAIAMLGFSGIDE